MRSAGAWVRLAASGAIALLLTLSLIALPAAADEPFAGTVDEIAAALKHDPILVQQIMGSGETAYAIKRIKAAVTNSHLDAPVYVALVRDPSDIRTANISKNLLIGLHTRLGDGIFIVQTSTGQLAINVWAEAFSGPDLARAVDEENARIRNERPASRLIKSVRSEEQIKPWLTAAMAIRIAAIPGLRLTDAQSRALISDDSGFFINSANYQARGRDASTGLRAMLATISALSLFLIVMRGLSWYGARTVDQSRDQSQPKFVPSRKELVQSLPTTAANELKALTDRIISLPTKLRKPELLESAQTAHEAAQVAIAQGTPQAYVGAIVLSRIGLRSAERARGKRAADYRCCFFNPLHGEAASNVDMRSAGLQVPACKVCARALDTPTPLMLPRPGRDRPYYDYDDVWARTGYGSMAQDFPEQVLTEGPS